MENPESARWIEHCAALLAPPPGWEPDLKAARARFEARLHKRSGSKRWLLAGVAAALIAAVSILAISPKRALAQPAGSDSWSAVGFRIDQLWYLITNAHVMSGIRWANLPEEVKALRNHPLSRPGAAQAVPDATEAARRAGFVPRLPHSGVLTSGPQLSVLGPMSFGSVIGARIVLQIGATVTAQWSNVPDERSGPAEWSELILAQGPAPVVATPPGFDLTAFTFATLRAAASVTRDHATRFSQLPTTAPALLFGDPEHNLILFREVSLNSGPATALEDIGSGGEVERVVLLWSVPGRAYSLTGVLNLRPPGQNSPETAAAFVNIIHIANSIY
jgi:hypothetical protein